MIFYQLKIIGEKEPASVKNTYKEIENGTFNVPVSNSIFSISDTPTSNKQQISEDIVSELRRLYYQGNVASLGRVYEAHSKAVKKEHCIKHKWDCSDRRCLICGVIQKCLVCSRDSSNPKERLVILAGGEIIIIFFVNIFLLC
ncbi:unnamed protein product [Rhizophagus irregularis]|nr:unnamed protein product [Rhizophagus irregularis]